jgi:CRP-like cAMP-binding protein
MVGDPAPAGRASGVRSDGPLLSTIDRVLALRQVAAFAPVPGRTLAAVASASTETTAPAGEVVIAQGAIEDHLFVVVSGRLRVERDGVVVDHVGPGQTVGELAALVPEPRSATVTAEEPVVLLRIDKPVLDELLADHPQLASSVIGALVRLIRQQAPGGPW